MIRMFVLSLLILFLTACKLPPEQPVPKPTPGQPVAGEFISDVEASFILENWACARFGMLYDAKMIIELIRQTEAQYLLIQPAINNNQLQYVIRAHNGRETIEPLILERGKPPED